MPTTSHSVHKNFLRLLAICLVGSAPAWAQSQQEIENLKETLSRTGVFFRADAPYVLRNPADPFLPVYVEIINGVEKTGRSAITQLAPYVTRAPLKLEGINVYAKPPGARRQFAENPILMGGSSEFTFDARAEGQPFMIADRLRKTLQIPLDTLSQYLRQHYLGVPPDIVELLVAIRVTGWPSQNTYLRVRLNAPALPVLPDWYRGDMHYHSAFTDNAAERGYPLGVTKQAAFHTGLRWVVLADHSTDLNPESYARALEEVRKYRDGDFIFIRGEEITVASGKEGLLTTLHVVALPSPEDPEKGFGSGPDTVITSGDGSVASPAIPLHKALERIAAADGFAYAAHPFDPVSPILRGGVWDLALDLLAPDGKALQAGLAGLALWNRATTVTADDARDPYCIRRDADPATCFQPDKDANHYTRIEKGIDLSWLPLLRKGLQGNESSAAPHFKVFLAAGSDAHGDFNYEATMDAVDFLSKPSRGITGYAEDNAFGKLATVVYCPEGMGSRGEHVLSALRRGHSVLSNGPLLVAGLDVNADGKLDPRDDVPVGGEATIDKQRPPSLQLQWASTEEFGPWTSIKLFRGTSSGEAEPEEILIPNGKELASNGSVRVELESRLHRSGPGWSYIRLEARTRNNAGEEFRCYTNPLWVRVVAP
jgi:hypothetical protein